MSCRSQSDSCWSLLDSFQSILDLMQLSLGGLTSAYILHDDVHSAYAEGPYPRWNEWKCTHKSGIIRIIRVSKLKSISLAICMTHKSLTMTVYAKCIYLFNVERWVLMVIDDTVSDVASWGTIFQSFIYLNLYFNNFIPSLSFQRFQWLLSTTYTSIKQRWDH